DRRIQDRWPAALLPERGPGAFLRPVAKPFSSLHHQAMMRTSPPTGVLTSLEAALAALLDGVSPVAPGVVPLDQAFGRVAAEMPAIAPTLPERDIAAIDGWACRALDLVGASAYSPLPLPALAAWVETGDVMPEGCDCVLQADLVDCSGP